MRFGKDFEKDEVVITIQGVKYTTHLKADLEIEYTPETYEVRASDNSCIEPPSGAEVDVVWAETTLTLHNDHGEEIGTLVYRGAEFFESLIDIAEEELDFSAEDLY